MSESEEAVRKALMLDDLSFEAHNTVGAISLFFEWHWRVADEQSKRAISINPNHALNHRLR